MPFLTEPEPPRGVATLVLPGIRRIVAANPSPMTYHGTNTYLLDAEGGAIVLDPGPDSAAHVEDILAAAGNRVSLILLSHTHIDHVGALAGLRARTGAPVAAWHAPAIPGVAPDHALRDGNVIAGMTVLHTPGHASDHICLATTVSSGERILFSADHVMSWSSSIVSPPDGDMADYMNSLLRLIARDDDIYLPGHGPPLPEPRRLARELYDHRRAREDAIADALTERGAMDEDALTTLLYAATPPYLKPAARRNVIAHLAKLANEGRVTRAADGWRSTPSTRPA